MPLRLRSISAALPAAIDLRSCLLPAINPTTDHADMPTSQSDNGCAALPAADSTISSCLYAHDEPDYRPCQYAYGHDLLTIPSCLTPTMNPDRPTYLRPKPALAPYCYDSSLLYLQLYTVLLQDNWLNGMQAGNKV